tara:strand:- start:793 stop:1050 length:258 start_codon:yes stop_codon:yes gene_type:complete
MYYYIVTEAKQQSENDMKTYYNSLVTMINAQAEMLKLLTGKVSHTKLKKYVESLVVEFKELGLNLEDDAKQALFRVENLHSITVD